MVCNSEPPRSDFTNSFNSQSNTGRLTVDLSNFSRVGSSESGTIPPRNRSGENSSSGIAGNSPSSVGSANGVKSKSVAIGGATLEVKFALNKKVSGIATRSIRTNKPRQPITPPIIQAVFLGRVAVWLEIGFVACNSLRNASAKGCSRFSSIDQASEERDVSTRYLSG